MAEGDIITMRKKELRRLHVVKKVLEGVLTQKEALEIIEIGKRQMIRIVKRVREEGEKGIIHRSRGRPSNRAYPGGLKEQVRKIYRERYWDFGPLLASEKLEELDKIKISDETLRIWLLESGDWQKRKKVRKHRRWRERKHNYGEMQQGDGSHHDWFEGRGPKCVLMGFIDDATGRVFARFYGYEGTKPAMDLMKKYAKKYGLPLSLYMDNHSTYKNNNKKATIEEELAGKKPLSQFERGVKELGIKFIHARSPQAKGRIERLFKTFQDRVIKEMRLAGVSSIREGNEFLRGYLPKYNKRFSVIPKEKKDMHMSVPPNMDLEGYLCEKTKHALRNDFTVAHDKKLYQVISKTTAKRVVVEERISGRIIIRDNGEMLNYREIKNIPKKEAKKQIKGKRMYLSQEKDHPWKKWVERGYPQHPQYQQKEKSSKKEKELLLVH